MLNEVCGLFEDYSRNTKFDVNTERFYFYGDEQKQALITLCDSINKNREVAGLLNLIDGDVWIRGEPHYSTKYIFCMLCFTKKLLNNLLWFVDTKIKKEGVLSRTIFNGVFSAGEVKNRIEKLPHGTTAKDALDNCVKINGVYFYSEIFKEVKLHKIFITRDKIHRIIGVLEKVGSDDGTYEIIQSAIKEIDLVMYTMIDSKAIRYGSNITHHACLDDVPDEAKEAEAMENTTQTLTLNRPATQQENKIITVGNKKAYTVGNGDYKHRNGVIKDGIVIKEEKAEMGNNINISKFHIDDKNILADLEDLLNNVIDNPDTVDELVNYLARNAPAAHFISEMVGCGEISDEKNLIEKLNRADLLSQRIINAGSENVHVLAYETKVFNYLNVAYPKIIFGKEFRLRELQHLFGAAAIALKLVFDKAKEEEAEEEQEEKEEVIANDDVQEHAEEDCEPHTQDIQDYDDLDFEELAKLMEERRKKEAELDAELAQAEEEKRKELIASLRAADKRIEGKEARLAKLREK